MNDDAGEPTATIPRMYRSMFPNEGDARPRVGTSSNELGARASDIAEAVDGGDINPGKGGMSVSRSLRELEPHLIPKRLMAGLHIAEARGSSKLRVWAMGDRAFASGAISETLTLRQDTPTSSHANVEPGRRMPTGDFQAALAATRDEWQVDEQ